MAIGDDIDKIGKLCDSCNQLDYLPLTCPYCKGTFCKDHGKEDSHHCPKVPRQRASHSPKPSADKPNVYTSSQCSEPSCKTFIGTPRNPTIHCVTCRRDYCLHHRHQESHNCSKLTPLISPLVSRNESGVANALRKLRTWNTKKKLSNDVAPQTGSKDDPVLVPSSPTSSTASPHLTVSKLMSNLGIVKTVPKANAARIAELNRLKKEAKRAPDAKDSNQLFILVGAHPSETNTKVGPGKENTPIWKPICVNKERAVGRALDLGATTLQVTNRNHMTEDEKDRLKIIHVESGRLLEPSEVLEKSVKNWDRLYLARGVGA